MSIFEISTLVRRGQLELGVGSDRWFGALRSLAELVLEPISTEIVCVASAFDAAIPGDPADRIIAATAGVPNRHDLVRRAQTVSTRRVGLACRIGIDQALEWSRGRRSFPVDLRHR